MTPKRKAALQWLHDAGEATPFDLLDKIGRRMFDLMDREGQMKAKRHRKDFYTWSLTDEGRQDLHDAAILSHIQVKGAQ